MTPIDPSRLEPIFKAYDIRGTVPDQLDAGIVESIGSAFARFAMDDPDTDSTEVLVGRDMRASGPEFAEAFARGVVAQGLDAVHIGLCSTDEVFFAAGHYDAPAAQLTASHNPARYNGMKLCLSGARPVGEDSGLDRVKAYTAAGLADLPGDRRGTVSHRDGTLEAFAAHVRSFVDVGRLRPLSIVADAANGMGGLIVPSVFEGLPFDLEVLFGELDGSFPNHPADPIQPENLRDLQARVLGNGADVGLAFDGDADRVFLVDDEGRLVSGSLTTAIVAKVMLDKHPGSTILHNLICSKAVREVILENGGTPVRTRVGHSLIKKVMAETGAAFGGEHSGHYYFRDNYRADSGIIAALVVLEALSITGQALSELRKPYERYAASGEINFEVADPRATIDAIDSAYSAGAQPGPAPVTDRLDGLTVDLGSWWFNIRPSNTEPLLRLNLEAATPAEVDAHVGALEALIREQG